MGSKVACEARRSFFPGIFDVKSRRQPNPAASGDKSMAMNEPFDWRRSERRLFLIVAIAFPLIVIAGFGPTYYFKPISGGPPLPSLLVHTHGLLMSAWIVFFVAQVWLIRTKNAKTHMNIGLVGIALAILMVIVGFFTAAAAARNGSPSSPPDIPPLAFFVVPFFDILLFAGLFTAAVYYRKRPANHKRLMLLTVLNFLPPAVGRLPVAAFQSLGPLFFFGVPAVLAIVLLAYDTWANKKLNKVFLVGAIVLIASYPLRMLLAGTPAWMAFAAWVTSWAA